MAVVSRARAARAPRRDEEQTRRYDEEATVTRHSSATLTAVPVAPSPPSGPRLRKETVRLPSLSAVITAPPVTEESLDPPPPAPLPAPPAPVAVRKVSAADAATPMFWGAFGFMIGVVLTRLLGCIG
jgi:hypothetical protein